ncbi:cysteine protease ATG4-like [Durio zibethinus]|uniref:Cysteine protease n=1 Tax=Durio zibethinus TaxID=66656 RepID=A0A6P5YGB7_DURZI|nr:cysteine protease ATG4-like [Durio zibethinus]XP_022739455.1 cysteine protease ATG4-like [Durio zibethinus]
MKGFHERNVALKCSSKASIDSSPSSGSGSEPGPGDSKFSKTSVWSNLFASAFSIFETYSESSSSSVCEKKASLAKSNAWTAAVKRVVSGGSMRRIHERVLGPSKIGISSSTSDIWLLGLCYKISQEESSGDVDATNGLAAFKHDFSSRILMTYRKGFDAIGDTKITSDVSWGCMLRSSQMLVAQALLIHRLGRSWRIPLQKPFDQAYIEILHQFGDSEASAFSIHNLVQAGKIYGLAAGSWVGPYAMCRSWESLARCKREENDIERQLLPMAVYVVSGDEDGERGGAPVVCIEDASRHCFEFSGCQADWTPILLLVPLVLGLDKVNPRYIPSLQATFTFPQCLGILGGKPGASTYVVGVQDENVFYLDPHDVQPVVNLSRDNLEADTSSYHCDIIRHISLDSIDPSLAIGFFCRDKDDFDDFCVRASKLADESNGAPLFTVAQTHSFIKPIRHADAGEVRENDSFGVVPIGDMDGSSHEDDWQLL